MCVCVCECRCPRKRTCLSRSEDNLRCYVSPSILLVTESSWVFYWLVCLISVFARLVGDFLPASYFPVARLRSLTVTLCIQLPHGIWGPHTWVQKALLSPEPSPHPDPIKLGCHCRDADITHCWTRGKPNGTASSEAISLCASSLSPKACGLRRLLLTQWAWNSSGLQSWENDRFMVSGNKLVLG